MNKATGYPEAGAPNETMRREMASATRHTWKGRLSKSNKGDERGSSPGGHKEKSGGERKQADENVRARCFITL